MREGAELAEVLTEGVEKSSRFEREGCLGQRTLIMYSLKVYVFVCLTESQGLSLNLKFKDSARLVVQQVPKTPTHLCPSSTDTVGIQIYMWALRMHSVSPWLHSTHFSE